MNIAYFDIFVKKSNLKGIHFAKDKLKAKFIKDDEIYSYFRLDVGVDEEAIASLKSRFCIKISL